MLEYGAPDKDMHGIHQVRRGFECTGQCAVGLIELAPGDVSPSGGYESVSAALCCKDRCEEDEGNREGRTARHGNGLFDRLDGASSTPADQCVIMKRATTWL